MARVRYSFWNNFSRNPKQPHVHIQGGKDHISLNLPQGLAPEVRKKVESGGFGFIFWLIRHPKFKTL